MIVYLVNIFLIVLFGIIFLGAKSSKRNKKIFCTLSTIQWVIISGLRHISIGADTLGYKVNRFDFTVYKTWGTIFEDFINIIFKGASGKDPGYTLFEKFVQIFTTNYQIFLIVIALIFTIPFGIWVYKNSSEPCISFLIYSCLFYSFFSITGHRQAIATALAILIGYKFMKERKIVLFLIIIFLAYTIHKSAIVVLPFYFLCNKKITKKYLVLFGMFSVFVLVLGKVAYAPIARYLDYEIYLENTIGGIGMYAFLMILVMIIGLWRMPIVLERNPDANRIYNAMFIGTLGTLMALQNQSFMRFQQYYTLFIMLLIPEIIYSFNKRDRKLVYYIGASLLILMFIKNDPQYLFFWQGW